MKRLPDSGLVLHSSHSGLIMRGFTLIETMVTLLVLTIGLLGSAYLQNWTMRYSHQAYSRSQSVNIVSDMTDRMRAFLVQPAGAFGTYTSANYTDQITALEVANTNCDSSTRTPRIEAICFYQSLNATIPNGNMSISTIDLDGDLTDESYRITVFWSDRQLGISSEDNSKILQSDCTGSNRIWSGTLNWPGSSDPGLCLASHSWDFEILRR